MTDSVAFFPHPVFPGSPTAAQRPGPSPKAGGISFDTLLRSRIEQTGVKFSRHAAERMHSRGIQFNPQQLERLQHAMDQVSSKGGRESLIMLDDTALVVSVRNDTVVTVVGKDQLQNNIFTNIDSAVIA
ncbi:MAG: TIGR02530 family flagellar biosynthesis protein [Pelovirga sp.]